MYLLFLNSLSRLHLIADEYEAERNVI